MTFTPADAGFEQRVRASFGLQRVMRTIGADLVAVTPGEVVIELAFREDLTQQHGYLHAAIVTAIVVMARNTRPEGARRARALVGGDSVMG